MNKFKNLLVWQKSIELAQVVYTLAASFPAEEKFGLQSQVRRCVVSIASNIAEGAGRASEGEFKHFLGIALGSGFELETQLILAHKFNYISNETLVQVTNGLLEIQRMINGLRRSIR